MGGQEFPAMDPERFLFGDMTDLNHLARVPGQLSPRPPNIKHTNTVRSLVTLHKESIRLVHHADSREDAATAECHLEFTIDSDVPCDVIVHFFVQETTDSNGLARYAAKHSWPAKRYDVGIGQLYSNPDITLKNAASYADEDLIFEHCGPRKYPCVIEVKAVIEGKPHVHTTFCSFDRTGEGDTASVNIRPIIQRLTANGLVFVLKEIYGIEQKTDAVDGNDLDDDDDNTECVVCMSATRDTMALPCRHLSLCNPCAEVLRYQSNKCPICRAPFHSLLQIRVIRPKIEGEDEQKNSDSSEDEDDQELAPPGFKLVSLVTAVTEEDSQNSSSAAAAVENNDDDDATPDESQGYIAVQTSAQAEPSALAETDGNNGVSSLTDGQDGHKPRPAEPVKVYYAHGAKDQQQKRPTKDGKARAAHEEGVARNAKPSAGNVEVHDFPSQDRLDCDDHVLASSSDKEEGETVSEFALPGTPDSARMKMQGPNSDLGEEDAPTSPTENEAFLDTNTSTMSL